LKKESEEKANNFVLRLILSLKLLGKLEEQRMEVRDFSKKMYEENLGLCGDDGQWEYHSLWKVGGMLTSSYKYLTGVD
jgi:hypothetical protein